MALTSDQVTHYRQHGWVAPIDILTEDEAAAALAKLEAAEAAHPEHLHAEHRNNAHLVFPFLADLAVHERIVDAAASLVGSDISLWSTVLFIKEPDSSAFVSWHQDAFYMGLEPDNFVTAWLALSPSTRDSGCVSIIPGTHRQRADHQDTFGEDNILTRGQTVTDVDPTTAIDLVLRPGQMSLHHPWLVHGSQPNRTATRRVGIAMQSYLGGDVHPVRGDHHVVHVRGAAPHADFVTSPLPQSAKDPAVRDHVTLDPAAIAARSAANEALSSVLYDGAETTRAL